MLTPDAPKHLKVRQRIWTSYPKKSANIFHCIWPITSTDTNLTVIKTCVKRTFNFDFCVRVTAYQLGAPNTSKQIDLDDHHPLLRSLTDALHLYEAFPEPHLNSHQLEKLEEHWKICISNSKKLNATKF